MYQTRNGHPWYFGMKGTSAWMLNQAWCTYGIRVITRGISKGFPGWTARILDVEPLDDTMQTQHRALISILATAVLAIAGVAIWHDVKPSASVPPCSSSQRVSSRRT